MFEVGDSFVLQNELGEHMHVIVAEASDRENCEVMLVYLTSATSYRDSTTIIKYGEHPFVTKVDQISWIKYQNVRIYARNDLKKLIVEDYGKIDGELLRRIQDGIEKSKFTSKENKNLFRQWHMGRLYRNLT